MLIGRMERVVIIISILIIVLGIGAVGKKTIPQLTELTAVTGSILVEVWDASAGVGSRSKHSTVSNLGKGVTIPNISQVSDITATAAELNYTTDVTSLIQAQINAKQALDATLTTLAAGLTEGYMWQGGATNEPVAVNEIEVVSINLDATPDAMADDTYNGITIKGINFGETVVQWACVFLAADGKVDIGDADAAGEFPAIGIVTAGGNDTDPAIILTQGVVRNEGWTGLTVGGAVYLGDGGAGAITQTAPSTENDCVQIIGRALSDSEIYFNFTPHWLLAGAA